MGIVWAREFAWCVEHTRIHFFPPLVLDNVRHRSTAPLICNVNLAVFIWHSGRAWMWAFELLPCEEHCDVGIQANTADFDFFGLFLCRWFDFKFCGCGGLPFCLPCYTHTFNSLIVFGLALGYAQLQGSCIRNSFYVQISQFFLFWWCKAQVPFCDPFERLM